MTLKATFRRRLYHRVAALSTRCALAAGVAVVRASSAHASPTDAIPVSAIAFTFDAFPTELEAWYGDFPSPALLSAGGAPLGTFAPLEFGAFTSVGTTQPLFDAIGSGVDLPESTLPVQSLGVPQPSTVTLIFIAAAIASSWRMRRRRRGTLSRESGAVSS